MKVLWLINIVLPRVATSMGLTLRSYGGGWLTGISEELLKRDDIQLAVMAPKSDVAAVEKGDADGLIYYFYPEKDRLRYNDDTKNYLKEIIDDFEPDIIHAFGTEYPRTYSLLEAAEPNKCVISLTGLVSRCAERYYGNIPARYCKKSLFRRALKRFIPFQILSQEQEDFAYRGKYEIKAIQKAVNVIGRTTYDKVFSYQENPEINYFHCGEILRQTFYEGQWEYEKCEKHRIFLNNAGYPIKGFHYMVKALPEILKKYPDTQIYVAGAKVYEHQNKIKQYILRHFYDYPRYLYKIIKSLGIEEHIHFTGSLNADQMKEQYMLANVFVLTSVIENSPNSLGEAMMLGVPSVAANVGGVSDMCTDKEDCSLYTYDDHNMLAHYVCEMFAETDYRGRCKKARHHADMLYSQTTNRDDLIKIYYKIVEQQRQKG